MNQGPRVGCESRVSRLLAKCNAMQVLGDKLNLDGHQHANESNTVLLQPCSGITAIDRGTETSFSLSFYGAQSQPPRRAVVHSFHGNPPRPQPFIRFDLDKAVQPVSHLAKRLNALLERQQV